MGNKGKKFEAAEKHFQKKELEFNRRLKIYEGQAEEIRTLNKRVNDLEHEKAELQEMLSKMLELKDMSVEELKEKIESDKAIRKMTEIFTMSGMPKYLY